MIATIVIMLIIFWQVGLNPLAHGWHTSLTTGNLFSMSFSFRASKFQVMHIKVMAIMMLRST